MAELGSFSPLLRQWAPNLSRRLFTGRAKCPHRQLHPLGQCGRTSLEASPASPFLRAFRSQSTTARASSLTSIADLGRPRLLPAGTSRPSLAARSPAEKSSYFPKITRSTVAWWLYGSAASVFGIVVFGGLTRLTESGLSITEWRPVTGSLPPMNASQWESEFGLYKASPEFKKLNPNMELSEFKKIYWMEWTHRLWGRIIGLSTLLPTIYFIARRRVSLPIARNLVLINGLIVTQGFVGWWMVKSGLKDDLFAPEATPRVSQYRLTTHLALAFTVFSAMLWNALQIRRERSLVIHAQPGRAVQLLARLGSPRLRTFRVGLGVTSALVAVTAMAGALVAGLDAGLIYNEWPRMGLGLIPPKSELLDPFYSRTAAPHPDLVWRNMLENPSFVQMDHRLLAYTTFTAVHALYAYARFSPSVRAALPQGARRALHGMLGLVWMQVALGLTTLLYLVPTPVAAAHQAGSLALLTGCIVAGSRVWTPPRLARMVKERAANVTRLREVRRHQQVSALPGIRSRGQIDRPH